MCVYHKVHLHDLYVTMLDVTVYSDEVRTLLTYLYVCLDNMGTDQRCIFISCAHDRAFI